MRVMKFREPMFYRKFGPKEGKFYKWHYWGMIGTGSFQGPSGNVETWKDSQECTGKQDIGGIDLYEGDIVKTLYNDVYDFAYYQIIYRTDTAMFWMQCMGLHHKDKGFKNIEKGGYCESAINKDVEIIGNIIENPELDRRSG